MDIVDSVVPYQKSNASEGEVDENEMNEVDELQKQEMERAERARRKAESRANAVEKWSHDKFDDEQQQPRSVAELVDRYGFDIRELDPTTADFSRPIASNGMPIDDSLSESSQKRPRPTQRRNGGPGKTGHSAANGGRRNPREPKQTPPRREKTPQIKNNKEFPELKATGESAKKDSARGNRRDSARTQDKKSFERKEPRTRKSRGKDKINGAIMGAF